MGKNSAIPGKAGALGMGVSFLDWVIVTSSPKATQPWPWLCMSRSIIQDSYKSSTMSITSLVMFITSPTMSITSSTMSITSRPWPYLPDHGHHLPDLLVMMTLSLLMTASCWPCCSKTSSPGPLSLGGGFGAPLVMHWTAWNVIISLQRSTFFCKKKYFFLAKKSTFICKKKYFFLAKKSTFFSKKKYFF